MKRFTLAVAFCFFCPSMQAIACEEFIEFSDGEVTALLNDVKSASPDDFTIMFDYQRLLCADRKLVRDMARGVGSKPDLPAAMRAAALDSAILEKDIINLTVLPEDGMTERQKDFLAKNPIISYRVYSKIPSQGCISLSRTKRDHCDPSYLISLSGTELDLRQDRQIAKLRLEKDGVMRGRWNNGNVNDPVAMRVELRLD